MRGIAREKREKEIKIESERERENNESKRSQKKNGTNVGGGCRDIGVKRGVK